MSARDTWPGAAEVSRILSARVDSVVKHELSNAYKKGNYWRVGSIANDEGSSLIIHTAGDKKGRWRDCNTASDDFGDMLDLIAKARGVKLSEAYRIACVQYLGCPEDDDDTAAGNGKKSKPGEPNDFALSFWETAKPITGTRSEQYLREHRRITGPLPECLRDQPKCPRGKKREHAMVAPFVDIHTNKHMAVHRTFLKKDASRDEKMFWGPVKGCAIKLTPDIEVEQGLAIAEGIESALSVMAAGYPVWAMGAAIGIELFPVLPGIECLTIFADDDEAGLRSARVCARRWIDKGREARILIPPNDGEDWNDFARAAT